MRIGQGYDAHRYADDDRDLVLGGVQFPGERGLHGHSDADVVAHAVIDALLGAAGLGDIGTHFPDTDPMYAGADSIELLRRTTGVLRGAGYRAVNVDCTVIADRPRIAPHREEMQNILSTAAGAPVTVCGKTTEGIGALGRGEGVVGLAVALVDTI
ncbi:MAG: 2-C-methyl-D-erythritol 2,4-cyclodiphosphate synthase [Candidatus Poriferisodalaceae bacterium]|jgi:2-C-methyl-D-erythritol 2,4-cyclodiphosphate synthase